MPDDLVADGLCVRVGAEQYLRPDAFGLTDEAEEDVLGTDVVVVERKRFPQRQVEHLLGAGRERDSAGDGLVARANHLDHLGADFVDGDVERVEDSGSESMFVSEDSQQQVLGVPQLWFRLRASSSASTIA